MLRDSAAGCAPLRTLVATALVALLATGAAAGPLSPVELGEAPIFERPTPLGDLAYIPGRGLRVGRTGLSIGGFANLTMARLEGGRGEIELQDLSLIAIWDPVPRLHLVFELNYADAIEIDHEGRGGSPSDRLTAERLYADVALTDLLNLRTGIFLTPVGRWNVIHAPPLVWTTERPLVTELPFDLNSTGVMLFGSVFPRGGVLTYSLWDQFADPLEGDPEFDPADHSAGGRLEYTADAGWSGGASYLAARRAGDWRHLGGLDLLWSRGPFEVMGEFVYEDGRGRAPGSGDDEEGGDEDDEEDLLDLGRGARQWGLYLQGVYALTDRWYLVGRYEHYAHPDPDPSLNLFTVGVAFRPLPAVVLKAEYLFVDRRGPEAEAGFHASIATLF